MLPSAGNYVTDSHVGDEGSAVVLQLYKVDDQSVHYETQLLAAAAWHMASFEVMLGGSKPPCGLC